jgi:hypothetical protein
LRQTVKEPGQEDRVWRIDFVGSYGEKFRLQAYGPQDEVLQTITSDGTVVDAGGEVLWDINALRNYSSREMEGWKYQDRFIKEFSPYYYQSLHFFPHSILALTPFDQVDEYVIPVTRDETRENGVHSLTIGYAFWSDYTGRVAFREVYDLDHEDMLLRFESCSEDGAVIWRFEYSEPVQLADNIWIPQKAVLAGMSGEQTILSCLVSGSFERGYVAPPETFRIDGNGRKTIRWRDQTSRVHAGAIVQGVVMVLALAIVGVLAYRRVGRRLLASDHWPGGIRGPKGE